LWHKPNLNSFIGRPAKKSYEQLPILEILRASLKGFREGYKLMASVKSLLEKNRSPMIAA